MESKRLDEIRARRADNFRELGSDEWRGQYARDIDYLLAAFTDGGGEKHQVVITATDFDWSTWGRQEMRGKCIKQMLAQCARLAEAIQDNPPETTDISALIDVTLWYIDKLGQGIDPLSDAAARLRLNL